MEREATVPEFFVEHDSQSEAEIRAHLNEYAKAVRAGDERKILAFYTDSLTAFDLMPPLQFKNKSDYQKSAWQECFIDFFDFPVEFEQHDLRVHADGNVAFSHCLVHMKGRSKNGLKMESWLRNSMGLQKIDGLWMITHEHNSVPLDKDSGAGLMDLAP